MKVAGTTTSMKTISLIGGMSWGTSAEYYRLTNLLSTKCSYGTDVIERNAVLHVLFPLIFLGQIFPWSRIRQTRSDDHC